jgi:hypothetical protein
MPGAAVSVNPVSCWIERPDVATNGRAGGRDTRHERQTIRSAQRARDAEPLQEPRAKPDPSPEMLSDGNVPRRQPEVAGTSRDSLAPTRRARSRWWPTRALLRQQRAGASAHRALPNHRSSGRRVAQRSISPRQVSRLGQATAEFHTHESMANRRSSAETSLSSRSRSRLARRNRSRRSLR